MSENSWFSNYLDTLEVFQLISNCNIVNLRKHVRFDCQKITKIFTINNNYVHSSGAPYRRNFNNFPLVTSTQYNDIISQL